MLGWEEHEVGNSPDEWFQRVHPEERERLKVELATHLEGLTPFFKSERRMLHWDGSYRWMLRRGLAVRNAQGQAYRITGSLTDLTDHKAVEE